MLRAENISLSIGKKKILDNISFQALPGELLAIVGANGAGKSSLLKVLSGDIKASDGIVEINGLSIASYKSQQLAKLRAVLAQSFLLNQDFLVSEVVLMGRYPHFREKPSDHDLTISQKAMEEVQVTHLKDRTYTTLSGGEKQRVHLARVLAQIWEREEQERSQPKYLFLDEPVSSLDLLHQHKTLQTASAFKSRGYVVIAVLHDLNHASQYADKVLMMKQGTVISKGSTTEVLTGDNILNAFGIPVSILNHSVCNYPVIVPDVAYNPALQASTRVTQYL